MLSYPAFLFNNTGYSLFTFADECDYSIPMNINLNDTSPIQLKLLCGADLLESFAVPGLWKDEDVRKRLLSLRSMYMYHGSFAKTYYI